MREGPVNEWDESDWEDYRQWLDDRGRDHVDEERFIREQEEDEVWRFS